jgi:phenylacetate-CoA ligase
MLYGGRIDVRESQSRVQAIRHWTGNQLLFGCFHLDAAYLMQVHSAFERFQPELLVGYASALAALSAELHDRGIRPTYPRRAIVTAAEKLEPNYRREVERVFSVPCVERYGTRDVSLIGYQLPEAETAFYIDTTLCLVEPDGEPGADGTADILVTTLRSTAMPLVRYRLGDIGVFPRSYSHGQPVTRLQSVVGRSGDFIYLPQGRRIHSVQFPHFFKDFDVRAYQVLQQADGRVDVMLVPGPTFSGDQRQLAERVLRETMGGVVVAFHYGHELERTDRHSKLRSVVSRCDPAHFAPSLDTASSAMGARAGG